MKNKNTLIALIVGFMVGILSIPTIQNLPIPASVLDRFGVGVVAAMLGALTFLGYAVAEILGKWIAAFKQIGRFAAVGVLNTVLDFAVLNLLITWSGVFEGAMASAFKGISFIVAVINSYYWNKYWTFEFKQKVEKEFFQFLIVSAGGLALNIAAFSLIVNVIGTGGVLWANIGALGGTFIGLAWNFIGYKFIVFKKR